MNARLSFVPLVCLALFSGVARADSSADPLNLGGNDSISDASPKTRGSNLSLMGYIPWYYGFGIGVNGRYEIPVLENGFIPTVNDSFSLEPSIGVAYTTWYGANVGVMNITPALYGMWDFYFSSKFSVYLGLGLGYNVGLVHDYGGSEGFSYFYWDVVLGLRYKLNESMALRAEVGNEALKLGVSFYF